MGIFYAIHTLAESKVYCFVLALVDPEDVLMDADADPLVAHENVVIMSCLACLQDQYIH